MANVDDRIVRMEFDNAAFERRLESTLRSLSSLNKALKFPDAGRGFSDISSQVKNFSLGGMSSAVHGVSNAFLALGTIAVTTLATITTKAVQAAGRIINSFSFSPIMAGFQEYELNMNSIQTILANTARDGTNLEQVNAALDQLNEYADKTIYNFAEMARNIGTFTAAGVDLDTSVSAIKGISNLAAISGSSSQQASTAMYQLSQAISTGTLRLMDWNSVVNAGMGGETFQRALFDTGVAMQTIENVPMGTTFDEWTEAGNTFRGSLEQGWLTADVLTNTLSAFAGEMTEAQLTAIGFTQEQAQEMMALGDIGVEAATKVRTLSQLIDTTKEAVGSGWSQSFRIIFGDFEEATTLFSGVSDSIGEMVSKSADSRNRLLSHWASLGGRTRLIYSIGSAFKSVGLILEPIQQAFRDVFPPMTAMRLVELTKSLQRFAVALRPTEENAERMRVVFRALFSALKIGWTVIKEGVGFIIDLGRRLASLAGGGGVIDFFVNLADKVTGLREALVDDGGIAKFFDGLTLSLDGPIALLQRLRDAVVSFFSSFRIPQGVTEFFSGLASGFGSIGDIGSGAADLWEPFEAAIVKIGDILSKAWDSISEFFSTLGSRIADLFRGDTFSGVLDAIDTGLLAGIGVLIARFLGGGLNIDIGDGFLGNLSGALDELNGVLGAMQTNLKAEALLKIAGAIGILAASILILSTVDPEVMTDTLAALAIGFGQLLGAFALLNNMGLGPRAAVTMNLIATSMVVMAGAVILLTGAIKLMSMMEWDELARGLVGVGGALALLAGASIAMSRLGGSFIRMSVGLIAVATALGIMAGVVKLFSMMDWGEIGKGLVGVAGALVALALGMKLMPKSLALQGVGLLLVATSLNAIAIAMKQFAGMDWGELAKGMVAIAGSLVGIALAMQLMPPTMPLIALGLLGVSASLAIIAQVMESISGMSWGEIAKGLVGIAGALVGIGLAMAVANSSILGAAGLVIVVHSLGLLVDVIQEMASLSWGEVGKGLLVLVASLGALGLMGALLTPVVGSLIGIGVAIALIGGGVALVGVGLMSLAKALELLARVGKAGIEVIITGFKEFAKSLPDILANVAEGILSFVETVLENLPAIVDGLKEVLSALLDAFIELVPKIGEAVRVLLAEFLKTVREFSPDLVQTGYQVLLDFLKGIRDNIGEIVIVVTDIITNFLDALALQIPQIIDSVYNLLIAVIEGVIAKLADIASLLVPKGMELIGGLVKGIDDNKGAILDFFANLPSTILNLLANIGSMLLQKGTELITGLYNGATSFFTGTVIPWVAGLPGLAAGAIVNALTALGTKGADLVEGLLDGAEAKWEELKSWFGDMGSRVWRTIGNVIETLAGRGKDLISGIYNGALRGWNNVKGWFADFPTRFKNTVGDLLNTLKNHGTNLVNGIYNGALRGWNNVKGWFADFPTRFKNTIGSLFETLNVHGGNLINGLYNGALRKWNELKSWFGEQGQRIRTAIGSLRNLLTDIGKNVLQSLYDGAREKWDNIKGWFSDRASDIGNFFKGVLGIGSPSKVFTEIGEWTMIGLKNGLDSEWENVERWLDGVDPAGAMRSGFVDRMNRVLDETKSIVDSFSDLDPTITPVIDLTNVRAGAEELARLMPGRTSYLGAAVIARAQMPNTGQPDLKDPAGSGEVKFEQNIYANKPLSTGDIYRNTRNQIALAKEELSIP